MNQTKQSSHLALKIILPLLVIALGIVAFIGLSHLKKTPQRQQPPRQGILVDVMRLEAGEHQVRVFATGTVGAEAEINLVPQVSGKVSWISPRLVTGGFFRQGETLLKIEQEDYLLAIEQAGAEVAQAEVALATEQEQAKIALEEWERVSLPDMGEPGPLVTREIQLRQQQAVLAAAEANLRKAELNLQRTELTAPFNGRIRSEQVDLGQYLVAGAAIAAFSGTDHAEISVPLPTTDLRWLEIPEQTGGTGSLAIIRAPGDNSTSWQGRIVRSLGEIDPDSRLATLVVSVADPYRLTADSEQRAALPYGLFVEVELQGEALPDVISLPRKALRSGEQVWIADDENRLRLRPVEILRREKDQILVTGGVAPGDKLVLTNISGAADGALLRPVLQEENRP